jgi:hypothetical protein
MKSIILILIFVLWISGCYTKINHPEVEIYYERENGEEYLTEDYDVFVDEDCSTCHDEFLAQKHYSPLIPAHETKNNWDKLPWWIDTKYLMFISGNDNPDNSESGSYGYQHVDSQKRTDPPPAQQGGYMPVSSGGSSTSSGSLSPESSSQTSGKSESRSRSAISDQNSGGNSGSKSTSSKRKFRKRR